MNAPKRPKWAAQILADLGDVLFTAAKHESRLTDTERDLVFVVSMRLRHRLGESGFSGVDLSHLSESVLRRAIKALTEEMEAGQ